MIRLAGRVEGMWARFLPDALGYPPKYLSLTVESVITRVGKEQLTEFVRRKLTRCGSAAPIRKTKIKACIMGKWLDPRKWKGQSARKRCKRNFDYHLVCCRWVCDVEDVACHGESHRQNSGICVLFTL